MELDEDTKPPRVEIPIHFKRLSHSTMELVKTCERKYQKLKLLNTVEQREDTVDTVFGKAFGDAVQCYFVTQSKEAAIMTCWMAYWPILQNTKKTQWRCLEALEAAFPVIDRMLETYEVAYFNGKPASELSFCLFTDSHYYFVGYIDLVLKHRITGKYIVLDAKTTGLELHDLSPIYKNSPQLIGYSIALDAIAGEDQSVYEVLYFVAKLGRASYEPTIEVFPYHKTLADRLHWFISLGMDIERLQRMEELNVYPMRGDACLKYNKPCMFFGTCDLNSFDEPLAPVLDEEHYDFYFNLDELIAEHVDRIA